MSPDSASAGQLDLAGLAAAVEECVDRLAVGGDQVDSLLLDALRASVDAARYWQDPDDEDLFLSRPDIPAVLEPVARAVATSKYSEWWSTPINLTAQACVRFSYTDDEPTPPLTGAADELREWRRETVHSNAAMKTQRIDRGEALWAMTSSTWWTQPSGPRIISTTRVREPFGPIGLWLVEDFAGDERARSWPVQPIRDVRIYEVTGAPAWAELVSNYPMDVTYARGANWLAATGRDGGWLIPDWQAVAADYDAVHLTIDGYLSTSGRVVPVDDHSASFVAGWNPDGTYWLRDVLTSGDATDWISDGWDSRWWPTGP